MSDREKIIDLYDHIISLHPEIDRKGKNNPYTSLNGHMFSMVTKEGQVGIRLSKSDREEFIANVNDEKVVTYNTIMKEYVCIPEIMLKDPQSVLSLLELSLKYIRSLKPKPSARKKT